MKTHMSIKREILVVEGKIRVKANYPLTDVSDFHNEPSSEAAA